MSQPDEVPPSFELSSESCLDPTGEPQTTPVGPSIENSAACLLDHDFNLEIVVFKVENRLFRVSRNGFNVPGISFEKMFALPTDSIEGSSHENPIRLSGIKVDHFRSFLRIIFPFIIQTPVVEFDEWVGVLNLATKWSFQEIRARAITELSNLIKQKTVLERVALAKEYQVLEWFHDAYLELAQKKPLHFEKLRPAKPYSSSPLDRNWEEDAKKWETTSRNWEMLAKTFYLQTKVDSMISSFAGCRYHCDNCDMYYGGKTYLTEGPGYSGTFSFTDACLCECRLLAMVDEAFRGELKGYPGYVEYTLPPTNNIESKVLVSWTGSIGKKKNKKKGRR